MKRVSEVVEAVAAALYEHATWHPPGPGLLWKDADAAVQAAWREEARDLIRPSVGTDRPNP